MAGRYKDQLEFKATIPIKEDPSTRPAPKTIGALSAEQAGWLHGALGRALTKVNELKDDIPKGYEFLSSTISIGNEEWDLTVRMYAIKEVKEDSAQSQETDSSKAEGAPASAQDR